jgi:hypothetical protein
MYEPFTLLLVYKLLVLSPHHVCWNVMSVECAVELGPWHLIVHGVSGGVVGPSCAGVSAQLPRGEESLLNFHIV